MRPQAMLRLSFPESRTHEPMPPAAPGPATRMSRDTAAPRRPWRRRLLIATGIAGGTLAVGAGWFYRTRDRLSRPDDQAVNPAEPALGAWVRIGEDDRVVVLVARQEMGQGVTTTLPMIVAEELDADPEQVRFAEAPVDPVYANATLLEDGAVLRPDDTGWIADLVRHTQYKAGELLGLQGTGGSTSTRDAWRLLRHAGAAARAMLVETAARRFGVPASECVTQSGRVRHPPTGREARFGELAAEAATRPIPRDAAPKRSSEYRLLGQPQRRLDLPSKVDGSAIFGGDVRVPGQVYAALVQAPTSGATVASVDDNVARSRRGVKDVVVLSATATSAAAVAVVAERTWQALAAVADLRVEWTPGPGATHDTDAQRARYESLARTGEARVFDAAGTPDLGLAAPPILLDSLYHVPYLAHAAMEPLNATALVRDGSCEIWVGNQAPTLVRWFAAKTADVPADRVTVHTPYLGGGFGRRVEMDVVVQAVTLAKRMPGVPVQLVWSREEDMRHDVYRPMATARCRAALDSRGNVMAWVTRVVSQSCTGSLVGRLLPAAASDAMKDRTALEGLFDLPYDLPHRRAEHVLTREPVPVGYWRSVGYSHNAFFAESFVDECAHAAKRDPFEFRRTLLRHAPRHRAVLEAAAARADWGAPLASGQGRGIALAESYRTIVAQVAEVEVRGAEVRVLRVVCAVDCGFALDPDIVRAQIEGGIVFGLTAALLGEITVKKGAVIQGNFGDYPALRLDAMPAIEVHIVNSGPEFISGIGEPGTPPVAPAVCNAIFAATGHRVRALPIRLPEPGAA